VVFFLLIVLIIIYTHIIHTCYIHIFTKYWYTFKWIISIKVAFRDKPSFNTNN